MVLERTEIISVKKGISVSTESGFYRNLPNISVSVKDFCNDGNQPYSKALQQKKTTTIFFSALFGLSLKAERIKLFHADL